LEEYDERKRGFLGTLGWWTGLSGATAMGATVVGVVALNKWRSRKGGN
jgi:hypothetical protein